MGRDVTPRQRLRGADILVLVFFLLVAIAIVGGARIVMHDEDRARKACEAKGGTLIVPRGGKPVCVKELM